jgi:choice-of-anchor B domain-containing protein
VSKRTLRVITLIFVLAGFAAAPSPVAAQEFGSAVAIAGRDVFIGQPGNQYGPGAVYVYRQDANGVWRVVAKLTMTGAANTDGFGRALAAAGGTLLVSSTAADSGRGAVVVFTRDAAGAWRQTGRFAAPDAQPNDAFGATIFFAGDRAYVASTGQKGRGKVYVFRQAAGTWAAETTLAPTDTMPNNAFGAAIAASGNRLMIGSMRADSGAGAVYVYGRAAATSAWKMEFRVAAPGPLTARNANFGAALLLRGDTALIGAPGDRFAGAVFILRRDSTTGRWLPVARALPFDGSFNARFGSAFAEVGPELWVGAPGSNQFQGRIYRLSRDSTGFTAVTKMGLPGLVDRAGFGGTLAVAGPVAVVGLPNQDFGEGGAALFTRRPNGTWSPGTHVVGDVTSLPAITGATRECTGSKVSIFDCNQVDLMSFLPVSAIGGKRGVQLSDVWGYTDPQTGREYVLAGRVDGTAFVDITDPSHPVYLGDLPKTAGSPATFWREIKTYKHYAFIVSDGARDHGMQIFDLDHLRNVTRPPVTFTEDAHYGVAHSVHDIVADTASGFIYLTGSNAGGEMCGGGLHMVDVHEPLQPKFAGCFADPTTGRAGTGYTHDAQCVVYHGPTAKYQGRQICFGLNETALSIADVTDKAHPVAISHATYPNVGYAHQGWLTDDQRYLYEDDELDEISGLVDGTRTLIWDVSDLENPVLAGQYISKNKATDHNLFLVGNTMYQANYVSGLRVLDITDRLHPVEIGFFDTHPVGPDEPGFDGAWGNYPFFKSGVVAVTSEGEGLFILKKHPTPPVP